MEFKDEDTRTQYHRLDTDLQLVFKQFEESLATMGYAIAIWEVPDSEKSEIIVCIDKSFEVRH